MTAWYTCQPSRLSGVSGCRESATDCATCQNVPRSGRIPPRRSVGACLSVGRLQHRRWMWSWVGRRLPPIPAHSPRLSARRRSRNCACRTHHPEHAASYAQWRPHVSVLSSSRDTRAPTASRATVLLYGFGPRPCLTPFLDAFPLDDRPMSDTLRSVCRESISSYGPHSRDVARWAGHSARGRRTDGRPPVGRQTVGCRGAAIPHLGSRWFGALQRPASIGGVRPSRCGLGRNTTVQLAGRAPPCAGGIIPRLATIPSNGRAQVRRPRWHLS